MRTCALVIAALAIGGLTRAAEAQITCPTAVTQDGTSANDTLTGTDAPDRLTGQGGDDVLDGRGDSDCLNGGSFNDRLIGGEGNDDLRGEGGNDVLEGGAGDDVVNGGRNNDTLFGGRGRDKIAGEGGNDVIYLAAGDVPAGQVEKINAGNGDDTLVLICFPPPMLPTPPGDFVLTDPQTGGTYSVRYVEVVQSMCP